ncbi:hypothetical protein Tco_1001358 [Tanacetum coccineum]
MAMSKECILQARYESKRKAIHLLLIGIGDEIYSTVDACKTSHEMWISIERLQQGESINIQDVKTNLFWEFRKFHFQGDCQQSRLLQQTGIQRFNCKEFGHFAKKCNSMYHKEKMLLCKQAKKGVPLQAEQADEEIDVPLQPSRHG